MFNKRLCLMGMWNKNFYTKLLNHLIYFWFQITLFAIDLIVKITFIFNFNVCQIKRYEKRDQTLNTRKYNDDLEEEIVHEEDIDPNTICLIDSEDEVSYEEEEEEEEGSDIDIDDDELELMEASNCPEFQTTFKQVNSKFSFI